MRAVALAVLLAAPAAQAESTGMSRALRAGWGSTAAPGEVVLEVDGDRYFDQYAIEGTDHREQTTLGVALTGGLPWGFELSVLLLPYRHAAYVQSWPGQTHLEYSALAWGGGTLAWRVADRGWLRFRLEATGGETVSVGAQEQSLWFVGGGGAASAALGPVLVECRVGVLGGSATGLDHVFPFQHSGLPYAALRTSVVLGIVSIDPELSQSLPVGPLPTLFGGDVPTVMSLGLRVFPADWLTLSAAIHEDLATKGGTGFGFGLTLRSPR